MSKNDGHGSEAEPRERKGPKHKIGPNTGPKYSFQCIFSSIKKWLFAVARLIVVKYILLLLENFF